MSDVGGEGQMSDVGGRRGRTDVGGQMSDVGCLMSEGREGKRVRR